MLDTYKNILRFLNYIIFKYISLLYSRKMSKERVENIVHDLLKTNINNFGKFLARTKIPGRI